MIGQKSKSADGGPSSQEVAARAVGGGSASVRGGSLADAERRAAGGRYEVTEPRTDGLPLPADRAPEPHGGHYFTAESFDKYSHVIGYDRGLAPGYDPTLESVGAKGDDRGKYEIREWTPPGRDPRVVLINHTHNDGAMAMLGIYAVDPSGNLVRVPPDSLTLKAGWKWAASGDLAQKNSAEEGRRKQEEELRKQAEKAPPAPVAPVAPAVPAESPESRKAREASDPVLQAERTGESKSDAERLVESGSRVAQPAHHDGKDKK